MLQRLHNIAPNSDIAIVASGPSAIEFCNQGELSIAVNGAAMLPFQFDYFLYGDRSAPEREWSNVDCARTRVVAHHVAATDRFLFPPEQFPRLIREAKPQSPDQEQLPAPIDPHLHFQYREFSSSEVRRDNKFLMYGGTISSCAVQLAFIMGATKIRLLGCEFSHAKSSYFRRFRHTGSISQQQLETMQATIDSIKQQGVQFEIHGRSLLRS